MFSIYMKGLLEMFASCITLRFYDSLHSTVEVQRPSLKAEIGN